jgi:hypothetical protein
MNPRAVLIALCLTPVLALAQMDVPAVNYPKLVKRSLSLAGFVPKGWVLEQRKSGDLNGDGRADAMLVLHQNDPRNVLENKDGLGVAKLNSNPRMIGVVFARAGGFDLIAENHQLVPRYDAPNMDDPFDGITLQRGTFRVVTHYWASAGSWAEWTASFQFRFQNGCVRLIGYDRNDRQRNSGEAMGSSVNFLTGQVKKTVYDPLTEKESARWSTLKANPKRCLETMGNGWEFEPESTQK